MAIQDQLELAIKETLQERRGSNGLPPENGVEIVQDDSVREVVDTLVPDPGLEAEINKRKKGGKSKRSTVKNKMQKKR
ncbi:MAG TPA: hypothetical protein HPQ00_09250 [Magnetococcales bacterium]|nr:hypothetical protein [Magnetococcales bacterium]